MHTCTHTISIPKKVGSKIIFKCFLGQACDFSGQCRTVSSFKRRLTSKVVVRLDPGNSHYNDFDIIQKAQVLHSQNWLTFFFLFHLSGLYFQNGQTIGVSNKDFSGVRKKGEHLYMCVFIKRGIEKGEIIAESSWSIIFIPRLQKLSSKPCFFLSSQKS